MSNIITATLVVNFNASQGSNSLLEAEIDDYTAQEGGLNNGNTSFAPGDSPGYLVYYSPDVSIIDHAVSLGIIKPLGTRLVTISEFLTFPRTREATLSKPAIAMPDLVWVGNSLGSGVLGPLGTSISFPLPPNVIPATYNSPVAVCKATYQAIAHQFRLVNIPASVNGLTEFEVLIYLAGFTEL